MSVSTSEHSRVERVRLTKAELEKLSQQEEDEDEYRETTPNRRIPTQRPQSGPSGVTVDPFNTPAPPTTPSSEPGN